MLRLVVYLFVASATGHIRGYSTVWRNEHDRIVKKVNYARDTRLTRRQPNELQTLNTLPPGFIYEEITGKSGFFATKVIDHAEMHPQNDR